MYIIFQYVLLFSFCWNIDSLLSFYLSTHRSIIFYCELNFTRDYLSLGVLFALYFQYGLHNHSCFPLSKSLSCQFCWIGFMLISCLDFLYFMSFINTDCLFIQVGSFGFQFLLVNYSDTIQSIYQK